MEEHRGPNQDTIKTLPVRRGAPKLARSLGPQLARLAKASGAMDPRLASDWPKIAGPEVAGLCRPVRIIYRGRAQALELSVKSGAAAMKIRYQQDALLGRIRQHLGLPRLTQIVFREGHEQKRGWESRRMAKATPPPERTRNQPKSENLKAALDQMRQTIHKADD